MALSFVFFGTPGLCLPVLERLREHGHRPQAVVCQPDRPRGRGRKLAAPPVKDWALSQAIQVHQPDHCKEQDFQSCLEQGRPDLGLVFAFGQLLPKNLLAIPRLGFLNIHPSLLPRYRGAAPVQWTLINGDTRTGVSILRVTPRLDDGDLLLQESTPVGIDENAVELGERLGLLGAEMVIEAFRQVEQGTVQYQAQSEEGLLWAPVLAKEQGRIDWRRPAREIHNLVRGVQPWPGASTLLQGRQLKIHRTRLVELVPPAGAAPGEVIASLAGGAEAGLSVATGEGCLAILSLQLEGKKPMDAESFLRGQPLALGVRLGE